MDRYILLAAVLVAAIATPVANAAPPQATKPVVVKTTASLKFVAARVASPPAPRAPAAVAPVDNDGDRFRYDSCGCVGR